MEKVGTDNLMVLLGTPTPESSKLYAMTVSQGDPTWAGALAGAAFDLPVFHITEQQIKSQIDPETYEAEVGITEMVLDVYEIAEAVGMARSD